MSETETEVVETTESTEAETQATEHQETAKQQQTLESIIAEEQAKRAERDKPKESEAEPEKVEDKKPEADKGKVKQSASERVQQAVNEKNEAIKRAQEAEQAVTSIKGEIQSLRDEIASINQEFKQGKISKAEAEEQATDASELFNKILGKLDVPPELEPYRDSLAKIAFDMADAIVGTKVSPLEMKLRDAEAKLLEREEREITHQREQFINQSLENYKAVAGEYAHLFTGENGEDGYPIMKPEFEKDAMAFAEQFNVQVGEDDKGKPVYHNKVLATKDGLEMLLSYVNRSNEAAQKAKEKIDKEKEAVNKVKKNRVETPESQRSTPAKKLTIEQIVQEEINKRK